MTKIKEDTCGHRALESGKEFSCQWTGQTNVPHFISFSHTALYMLAFRQVHWADDFVCPVTAFYIRTLLWDPV